MDFEPKSEEEIKKERSETFEPGEYDFTVEECIEKESKGGNPMFSVRLGVYVGDSKESCYDYLLPTGKMAWKFRHFCDSIGIIRLYEKGTVSDLDILHKSGKAHFEIEEGTRSYSDKNKVDDYVKRVAGAPEPVKAQSFDDDSIPF